MALESASYITQLNASNPTSTDTVSQADDHLRLIKNVLKNTFPNLDQPVLATPAQINSPIPSGLISMWSGSVATIPSGWKLCDGTSGTPDLRGRFIVGAGGDYSPAATGGSATQTLTSTNIPAHTHTFSGVSSASGGHTHSITDPGHSHGLTLQNSTFGGTGGGTLAATIGSYSTAAAATGITINAVGDHTHTYSGTTSSVGSGTAFSILPPYYALAFIMKL